MSKLHENLDRLPPQSLDAEKGVLGSLLLDPAKCDEVAPIICADDFYAHNNQQLYGHLLAMRDKGEKIDAVLLQEWLKRAGEFEAIGGSAYLAEVAQSVPYAANAVYYANIVRRKAIQRELIHAGTEIVRDAYNDTADLDELGAQAERALKAIGQRDAKGPRPFREIVLEAIERVDEAMRSQRGLGLATGLPGFDEFYGGLFPGELTVLAARPSVGKTALACQIGVYNASLGRPVYLASLEMTEVEITMRLLCGASGVSSQRVRGGHLEPDDVKRLTESSSALAGAKLFLDDRPELGTAEIRATTRQLARDGLDLVVVDYLQLLKPANTADNRTEQVGRMARDLKGLARELSVPVLCLCQLNRQAAIDTWPDLHHLRDSGEIEQHADVVTFLHKGPAKEPREERQAEADDARWIVRKNRMGETGVVRLHWSRSLVGFEEVVRYPLNQPWGAEA